MRFRLATALDVFPIISLAQKSQLNVSADSLFADYKKLEKALSEDRGIWVLAEVEGAPSAVISIVLEKSEGIAKVNRMFVDREKPNSEAVLRETLKYALHYLEKMHEGIDMVYSSTMSMTLSQQELTLNEGFQILGVFPNALGEDNSKLNGLTGYYFDGVLDEKRVTQFQIHPTIEPFFRISQKHYNLPDVQIVSERELEQTREKFHDSVKDFEMPRLEIIQAEEWVGNRFQRLRENNSQVSSFYPFYTPNSVLISPKGGVEIYLRISAKAGFCAVIGERMRTAVDPIAMYKQMLAIVREQGVSYVEIINDAADLYGNDCIMKAGFTPCAYVPGFKRQGTKRRDYIVYGKSFEYLCRPDLESHKHYLEFYREYFKIEGKNYFPDFIWK